MTIRNTRFSAWWMGVLALFTLIVGGWLAADPSRRTLPITSDLHTPAIAITGATVIKGTGELPIPDQTILIENGRIARVFPQGQLPIPGHYEVVSGDGAFVLPGLIDAHVHLATDPSGRDRNAYERLQGALRGGVTTVRDMAGDATVLRRLARRTTTSAPTIPDIYYSAVIAGPTFFQDARTRSAAGDYPPGKAPWLKAVAGTQDIHGALVEAQAIGASGIKIYADLPPALTYALVREAKRQGMRVWAHATVFPTKPSELVGAGADVLSHAILLYYERVASVPENYHARPASDAYDSVRIADGELDSLFRAMARKGVVLDATLFISAPLESARPGVAGLRDPARAVQWMYAATGRAHRLGVKVAAGTDGFMPGDANGLPNIHRELELLVTRAGLSPLEAITAATRNSAIAIGIDGDVGTIEPGKRANLIVVSRNPTTDIANLRHIELVIKDGVRVPGSDKSQRHN